jgi:hypothetical protein
MKDRAVVAVGQIGRPIVNEDVTVLDCGCRLVAASDVYAGLRQHDDHRWLTIHSGLYRHEPAGDGPAFKPRLYHGHVLHDDRRP